MKAKQGGCGVLPGNAPRPFPSLSRPSGPGPFQEAARVSIRSPRSAARVVGSAVLVGGLLVLAGCQDRYPPNMTYPLRTDPLVLHVPTQDPTHLDPPGDLLRWLADVGKQPGADEVNPAQLSGKDTSDLDAALRKLFGTPADPKVEGLDSEVVATLKLDHKDLAAGAELYRRHCLHCHGLTGNGQGPTAPWVNPHPRDYRRGIFKFTSSGQPSGIRKPRRTDLVRTVTQGVEGTAMPAFGAQSDSKFGVLHEDEIERLVSYVIHLSLRGDVEFQTMQPLLKKTDLTVDDQPATIADYAADTLKTVASYWAGADDKVIKPAKYPYTDPDGTPPKKSIENGYNLFVQPGPGSCIKCHLDFGRRNNYKYDDWGTVVRPLDLTQGVYRGGRRPVDLYWRISGGVNGASMPAFSDSLKPDQIWDVVNFVRTLPYPAMLPEEIRKKIYETSPSEQENGSRTALARPATAPAAQE
jgi:mono/diheme cytochrome c family protein